MARLIDADKLLEAIANSGLVWETNECLDVIEVLAVKKIIDDAPTIDPITVYEFKGCDNCELDRPKGKWILDSIGCYCSECKKHPDVTTDYCPFCGANMRGDV